MKTGRTTILFIVVFTIHCTALLQWAYEMVSIWLQMVQKIQQQTKKGPPSNVPFQNSKIVAKQHIDACKGLFLCKAVLGVYWITIKLVTVTSDQWYILIFSKLLLM